MLTYMEAYLHPDKLPPAAGKTRRGKTLPAALRRTLKLHDEPRAGMWQALAWGYKVKDGS